MEKMKTIFIYFVLWFAVENCEATNNVCTAIITPDFTNCSTYRHPQQTQRFCSNETICGKEFVFTSINMDPFRQLIDDIFSNVMEYCCGSCRNMSMYDMRSVDLEGHLNHSLISTSNFIFPVLGRHDENVVYNYHFIPLLELSSGYYITRSSTSYQALKRLIQSCVNLWPLLVIIMFLAFIAGMSRYTCMCVSNIIFSMSLAGR